jgi:hypothetical protein
MSNPINNPEELIQSVLRIFRTEMELKQDQTLIQNQPFRIPKDSRLYLSVGLMGGRTFAAKTQYVANPDTPAELTQIQGVNRQELLSIHALSKGEAALQRNWEIPVALNSLTAQQAQEEGSFKIGNVPLAMNDLSGGEGARRIYEYSLTVAVLVAYRKTSSAQFFDSFQTPAIITNQ